MFPASWCPVVRSTLICTISTSLKAFLHPFQIFRFPVLHLTHLISSRFLQQLGLHQWCRIAVVMEGLISIWSWDNFKRHERVLLRSTLCILYSTFIYHSICTYGLQQCPLPWQGSQIMLWRICWFLDWYLGCRVQRDHLSLRLLEPLVVGMRVQSAKWIVVDVWQYSPFTSGFDLIWEWFLSTSPCPVLRILCIWKKRFGFGMQFGNYTVLFVTIIGVALHGSSSRFMVSIIRCAGLWCPSLQFFILHWTKWQELETSTAFQNWRQFFTNQHALWLVRINKEAGSGETLNSTDGMKWLQSRDDCKTRFTFSTTRLALFHADLMQNVGWPVGRDAIRLLIQAN